MGLYAAGRSTCDYTVLLHMGSAKQFIPVVHTAGRHVLVSTARCIGLLGVLTVCVPFALGVRKDAATSTGSYFLVADQEVFSSVYTIHNNNRKMRSLCLLRYLP